MGAIAPIRIRREPETTVLYQVLAAHLETNVSRTAGDQRRPGLPGFVVRELRAFLRCGILGYGFCRVSCAAFHEKVSRCKPDVESLIEATWRLGSRRGKTSTAVLPCAL